jgi:Rieske Fe-S protein
MTQNQLSRRDVIKTLLVTSATSLIGGNVWAGKVVSEITANVVDPNIGVARVRLSAFAALNNNGGSVRLGSSGIQSGIPRGLFWPILINRISATEYVVLDTACSHAGCIVPTASSGTILCSVATNNCGHGSRYDIRGNVLQGPATTPLRKFPATLNNGILVIQLSNDGIGFNMLQKKVLNGAEERLQITWDSYSLVEYELRYRPDFATEPLVVPFSTTLTGAFATTFVTGNDRLASEPLAVKMFVAPQSGIYQVAIRLRTV